MEKTLLHFRKTNILFWLVLLHTISPLRAMRLEINNTAGQLQDILPDALFEAGGIPISEVTTFVIKGTINTVDLTYIRDNHSSFAALDTLDLGVATFEPVTINGTLYPADAIAPYTFDGFRTLSCIYLPETVKRICTRSFAGCSAMKKMPDSVEIVENEAFPWGRSLGNVTTSTALKTVGDRAWAYCDGDTNDKGLNNIVFPSLVLESFGYGVFENCDLLESVTILKPIPPTASSFGNNLGTKKGGKPILWVPDGSVNAYKNLSVYNTAFDIRSISEFTDVKHPMMEKTTITIQPGNIQLGELEGKTTIAIFSTEGKVVYREQTNSDRIQISTEKWPAGIYLIKLENSLGEHKNVKITTK